MSRKNIPGIIAVFETILIFAMGVMGNKISDELSVAPIALVTITGLGLVAMTVISYFNSLKSETHNNYSSFSKKPTDNNDAEQRIQTNGKRLNFIPKTMLGIFPIGILLGFICGFTFPSFLKFLDNWFYISIDIPFTLPLSDAEALGIYVGVITSLLLAIFLDGYLGAALSLSFGLSFPVTLINIETWHHNEITTFFGHLLSFIFLGVILIVLSPLIENIRPGVFRLLQNLKKVLTQQRI